MSEVLQGYWRPVTKQIATRRHAFCFLKLCQFHVETTRLKVILNIFLITNEDNSSLFRSYKDKDTMTIMKYARELLKLCHVHIKVLHGRVQVCVMYNRVSFPECNKFIWTANGFLPGGSGTTVRHNTQIHICNGEFQENLWHLFIRIWGVLTMENDWVFGLCPLSRILNIRKHDLSETGSVSIHRWGEEDTYSVQSIRKRYDKRANL
jgi:hypothetical protein